MKIKSFTNARGNKVANAHIVELGHADELLIHYDTAIAGFISGKGYVRTDTFHSATSSKHINHYCGGKGAGTIVEQEELDRLKEAL